MDSNINTRRKVLGGRKVLYGLPCAECRIYYPADLNACPVCDCRQRITHSHHPQNLAKTEGEVG